MQIPTWVKPSLWSAGGGAIAMAVVGFSQLGWETSRSANELAEARADSAVTAALVPFCVAKAEQVSDQAMLAKVRAEDSSYSRSDLVIKAGWATVGNDKSPDSALATACGDRLHAPKSD